MALFISSDNLVGDSGGSLFGVASGDGKGGVFYRTTHLTPPQ